MRVALVVTGELERLALGPSLARLFPEAEFRVESSLGSFTSGRVRNLGPTSPPGLVDKLAAALVAAVDPGRSGTPSDLAIAVDDLEVQNLDQPEVVVETFRDAVVRHVEEVWSSQTRRDRARQRLRDRASFHLLAPMPEAFFFGDSAPLAAAGAVRSPSLAPGVDLEDFTVSDEPYLSPDDVANTWARPNRARHPKHYLQYLIDPTLPAPTVRYRETKQGVAALGAVDWGALAGSRPTHLRLLRSLLQDLGEGLGAMSRVAGGEEHPATSLKFGVLRNG